MKSIKKIAAAALACVTAAMTFAGCGNSSNSGTGDSANTEGKVYNVGICQLVEHAALDAATQGFKDKLTELLGADNVVFYEQNAQGESTNCSTICQGFVSNGYDLILANATPALQAAAASTNVIPILGTSVTDYGTALDISDWTGTTGTNISGTADLAPIDEQEKMLKELFPNVKQVGILYCSSEANSKYQAQKFGEALSADGIAFKEYSAADSNEIQSITNTAVG
ncbi:MAG: ABC transporter substrate-binding protein, partial [Oscillospiraceae bacterium]